MTQDKEGISSQNVWEGAKRLWRDFDRGALREAERRRDEAPREAWEWRWWEAIRAELHRQFYGT